MVLIFRSSASNFDSMSMYFNFVFKGALRAAASEILEILDVLELRENLLRDDLLHAFDAISYV